MDEHDLEAVAGKALVYEKMGDIDGAYVLLRPYLESRTKHLGLAAAFADICHRVNRCPDAVAWLESDANNIRGEFVVIVANTSTGAALEGKAVQEQELERTLSILCSELPLRQAVALAVKLTGEKKNKVYDLALKGATE